MFLACGYDYSQGLSTNEVADPSRLIAVVMGFARDGELVINDGAQRGRYLHKHSGFK